MTDYLEDLTQNKNKKQTNVTNEIKHIHVPLHSNIIKMAKKYHKTTNNEYLYQSYNDLIIDGLKQHKTKIQKIDDNEVDSRNHKSKLDALPSNI